MSKKPILTTWTTEVDDDIVNAIIRKLEKFGLSPETKAAENSRTIITVQKLFLLEEAKSVFDVLLNRIANFKKI